MSEDPYIGKIVKINSYRTMEFDKSETQNIKNCASYNTGSLFYVLGTKTKKSIKGLFNEYYIMKPLNADAHESNVDKELVWYHLFYVDGQNNFIFQVIDEDQ